MDTELPWILPSDTRSIELTGSTGFFTGAIFRGAGPRSTLSLREREIAGGDTADELEACWGCVQSYERLVEAWEDGFLVFASISATVGGGRLLTGDVTVEEFWREAGKSRFGAWRV